MIDRDIHSLEALELKQRDILIAKSIAEISRFVRAEDIEAAAHEYGEYAHATNEGPQAPSHGFAVVAFHRASMALPFSAFAQNEAQIPFEAMTEHALHSVTVDGNLFHTPLIDDPDLHARNAFRVLVDPFRGDLQAISYDHNKWDVHNIDLELVYENTPGVIVLGKMVIVVSGLGDQNDEAAGAIALHVLEHAEPRQFGDETLRKRDFELLGGTQKQWLTIRHWAFSDPDFPLEPPLLKDPNNEKLVGSISAACNAKFDSKSPAVDVLRAIANDRGLGEGEF